MRNVLSTVYGCRDGCKALRGSPVLLILSTAEDISGGEIFLLTLVEKMRGWVPVVATPNPDLARRCRALGAQAVIIHGLRSLRREHRLLALWRLCFCQSAALLRLLFLAIRSRTDVIMAGSFSAAHFAFALSRLLNRPALWSHQHPVLKHGDTNFRIASWLLKNGGMAAVACSQAVARSLEPLGSRNANVAVITNSAKDAESAVVGDRAAVSERRLIELSTICPGIDVAHFRRAHPYPRARRPVIVGLVAMITPWKGQHLLIEAVRLLRDRGLTEASFICHLVGGVHENRQGDKLYCDALSRRIIGLGLGEQVILRGKQTNMRAVYEDFDIVVSCSMEPEPFGIGIVEAMSMECVVVAPNEGGPAEIVRDGQDGFLFTPRSADNLSITLQHVVANIDVLDDIRRAARKSVCARFSSASMADDYEAFFTRLFSSQGGEGIIRERLDHPSST